jgi:hypothetical protein
MIQQLTNLNMPLLSKIVIIGGFGTVLGLGINVFRNTFCRKARERVFRKFPALASKHGVKTHLFPKHIYFQNAFISKTHLLPSLEYLSGRIIFGHWKLDFGDRIGNWEIFW